MDWELALELALLKRLLLLLCLIQIIIWIMWTLTILRKLIARLILIKILNPLSVEVLHAFWMLGQIGLR